MHNTVSQRDLAPSIKSPPCAGFFVSKTSFHESPKDEAPPYSFHNVHKPAVCGLSFTHKKYERAFSGLLRKINVACQIFDILSLCFQTLKTRNTTCGALLLKAQLRPHMSLYVDESNV
ncbi:hypothetical protein D3C84_1054990 [compost metagenome]